MGVTLNNSGLKTFTATAVAIPQWTRVKFDGTNVLAAGADNNWVGTTEAYCAASGDVAVRLRTAPGDRIFVASGAITVGDILYPTASGKVRDVQSSGGPLGFMALTSATADGDFIEATSVPAGTSIPSTAFQQTVILPLQLADIAAGTFKVALPFAATIVSALFRTAKAATTAAKAATLTVTTNGGGAVTGGVMALTSANQNTIGGTVAASAISGAGATIAAGQTIEVTASLVTTFVEGDGWIEFTVKNNDLANSFA